MKGSKRCGEAMPGRGLILWIGCSLTVAACLAMLFGYRRAKPGTLAEVSVGGTCVAKFSLDEDREYAVEGADGHNLLVIRDGRVWMQEADCPDRLCVSQRAIRRQGECIVCLPHRVVVTIVGEQGEAERADPDLSI